jgi:membrane fusion protein (multidrug efflux system)
MMASLFLRLLLSAALSLGVALPAAASWDMAEGAAAAFETPGGAGLALIRQIRVQVVPRRTTVIASAMAGRITQLSLRDGDRFTDGQVLARFDCDLHQAQVERVRARLEKAKKVLEVNTRLNKLGSVSALDLALNQAKLVEATAELRAGTILVQNCTVTAPFAGRVTGVSAQAFQYIGEGQPMLEIIDDTSLEVELVVPSRWLAWLTIGRPFTVRIGETGRTYSTEVIRLAGRVDPVSQSVKVYGRLAGKTGDLLAGMSGEAQIEPPDAAAPNH